MVSVAVALVVLCLGGCGTNRNTAASRQWQAFTTRYNVYYNGDEHYKEQLKEMEKSYEDDYTRRTLMHPAEAKADQKRPQPSGDFKRTIEKMQKAIQLHSISKKPKRRSSSPKDKAFRAREEFNPFLHNAWLMMGRAQYYNGDFMGAAATFFYIQRHFKWKPEVVAEAQLWQALAYCALDWVFEAENVLVHVKRDKLPSKRLMHLYDFVQADYLIRAGKDKEAIPYLSSAAEHAKGAQRNRLYFLLGQIESDLGNREEAYRAFAKAGSGAGTNYRTKFNARIKQSEVYTGKNYKKEIGSLRSLARYGRNSEYLDQIYYAIGNLYLAHGDTEQAEKNYRTAVEKSTRSGIDKALAQLALGKLLFDKHDYVGAQPCYSEAVPVLPDNYPDYKNIKRRSDVLDELAEYSGNVHLQDSLLTLSKMTPEEQRKACERLAKAYEEKLKKEAEDAKREEYLAEQNAQGSQINDKNAPTQFQINTDKSWYFYNTQTKNQGKTEFQRRWGSRKNEDDWRRRNKNTFSLDSSDEDVDGDDAAKADNDSTAVAGPGKELADAAADPTKAEYYLKDIPTTDAEIATCNEIIAEGLYNMGLILKDKLEDFAQARSMFLELEERYPDNIYRLDTYYNMYLMAVRINDNTDAEKWREKILTDFAESNYGMAMRDPNYFDNLRRMNDVQEQIYSEAYQAYLDNDNARVHALTAQMEKDYPLSKILPKFVFIDALSYVTDRDDAKFKERLEELLQKWPETDMTSTASDMLKLVNSGRKLASSESGNRRGMLWETRLIAGGDADEGAAASTTEAKFDLDPNKPQLLVLAFPIDSVSPNQLLYDVARHNFSSFVVKDFELEQMNFGNIGLLVIKGFANMKELEHYRTVMARDEDFIMPPQVRPIMISDANFRLLLSEGRSFEEYFDFEAREKERKTEEAVVGEDNTLPADTPEGQEPAEPTESTEATEASESPDESPVETPLESVEKEAEEVSAEAAAEEESEAVAEGVSQ